MSTTESSIRMGNDEFILYLRKRHRNCQLDNALLGKRIWAWLKDRGARKIQDDAQTLWSDIDGDVLERIKLPRTAAQFEFDRSLIGELYSFLDTLGSES